MLFGVSLTDAIHTLGVIGILGIVFAESGMMVGFFLPGDTLLFTAGFMTQIGALSINIHLLVVLIALAAIYGDNLGYLIGRKVGRKLFRKPDSVLFHQENLRRAEAFYERFGPATVMIARFVPVVRTFAPVVAGIGNMRYLSFLLFDIAGSLLWSASITYLGYYGGAFLQARGINVEAIVLPIVLLALLVSLGSPIVHILSDKKNRSRVAERFKRVFKNS